MDFLLFVIVSAILFVRPMDFVPGLEAVPLYYIAIVCCLLASAGKFLAQLSSDALQSRPITAFMIGMLLMIVFTDLAHGAVDRLTDFAPEYAKLLIYLILLVGVVDTPRRLRLLLACLVFIDLIPTLLALLHYHGTIYIPAYEALDTKDSGQIDPLSGFDATAHRLKGSGNFGDPNDICEVLNQAIMFGLAIVMNPGSRLLRLACLMALPAFGYAIVLSQSRGGFIGLMVGLMVLFLGRFGRRKSILLGGLVFPLVFLLFGGRQTSISATGGTGQQRIQVWAEGFILMKGSPIWGIGTGEFPKNVGHTAHNSFVLSYTELGFAGGTLYFGMYFCALMALVRLGSRAACIADPEIDRMRPYILAAVAGYASSELSLTHCYALSTYVILGLAAACLRLAAPDPPPPEARLDGRLVMRVAGWSFVFLVALFVFTQLNLRYRG